MEEFRWAHGQTSRAMYRDVRQLSYPMHSKYRFAMKLKNGIVRVATFRPAPGKTPYDFIVKGIFDTMNPNDILEAELFLGEEYVESYTPESGWFKKNEVKK